MSRKRRHEDAQEEEVFVYHEDTCLSSIPSGITSLRIDSSVKKIPREAFSGQRSLTNVEYQEGLEVIGEKAFEECSSLREQQFPSTLIEIGKYAFQWCQQLESVGRLPLSVTIIREHALYGCSRLQNIEIVNEEICLEDGVFWNCKSLNYLRLPRGMVTVPAFLFYGCISLVDVDVPSSVIEIGVRAFAGCEKLAMIELPAGLKRIWSHAFNSSGLEHFHCPAMVESIDDCAFSNCTSLESVILPPKLKVISKSTFASCYKLKEISIPQSVVRIGKFAFAHCGLTRLDFSRCNIMRIEKSAFAGCSDLKSVILPRTSLKRIEEGSFENCNSLTHLWIPPTVEYIEDGAFADCISLLSLEVPETLKSLVFVGHCEFDGELCGYESLVNIYLPPSHELDDVDDYDFMEDMKLGEAEGSYPELVGKLKRRFNLLPLHRACYFQSYHSLQENIKRIRSIVRAGPRACERVDFLGMTAFHILALSQRPWLNLFQELLSVSSVDIMKCRDVFGSTPLDYLCENHSSAAVCVTKSLLVNLMEPRISFLGRDCWRDDVMSHLEEVLQVADASSLGPTVRSVCQTLAEFERMEVLSLLEMSLWRMKVEEEKVTGNDARESCRINCGSSIVLENVIPLLGAND